jgi:hypothetical protein
MPLYLRPSANDSASFHTTRMRRSMFAIGTVLLTLLTASAVFADKESKNGNGGKKDKHPASQSSHPSKAAKPAKPAKEAKVGKKDHPHDHHPERTVAQSRQWHDNRGWEKGSKWRGHGNWKGNRSANWHRDHATWIQRGGYQGYYIPGPTFSQHFGRNNGFLIASQPVVYQGYSRFNHGGQSFVMVDPYPSAWSTNWYARDEVVVEYDQGYYLYNRKHPGYPIALVVVR